jgi:hypothetical protein
MKPLRWSLLTAVAVAGSLLYGASLAPVWPGFDIRGAALWLAASAGLAWCVFIPTLIAITRRGWAECVDACLVTMAWGEVVLIGGAAINVLLWRNGVTDARTANAIVIAISNVVMALVLARRLAGVPPGRVYAAWMLVLNGAGAVFFLVLYPMLHRP